MVDITKKNCQNCPQNCFVHLHTRKVLILANQQYYSQNNPRFHVTFCGNHLLIDLFTKSYLVEFRPFLVGIHKFTMHLFD